MGWDSAICGDGTASVIWGGCVGIAWGVVHRFVLRVWRRHEFAG